MCSSGTPLGMRLKFNDHARYWFGVNRHDPLTDRQDLLSFAQEFKPGIGVRASSINTHLDQEFQKEECTRNRIESFPTMISNS